MLEEVPRIGPAIRIKLIKTFGSLRAVSEASQAEVVAAVGAAGANYCGSEAPAGPTGGAEQSERGVY